MNKETSIIFYIKKLDQADYTIDPVIKLLNNNNIKVIHSSFLNGQGKNCQLDGELNRVVDCIDLRIKNYTYIYQLIKKCNVFVIFGHNSFIEFILSAFCSIMGKNSIYVQHGLFVEKNKFIVNKYWITLKKYFCYFVYYVGLLLSSILKSKVFKMTHHYLKYKTEISFCKQNLFFDQASADSLMCYGEKYIIGSPSNLSKPVLHPTEKIISYIQSSFIPTGTTSIDRSEEKIFFEQLIDKFISLGFTKIKFFLHPAERKDNFAYLKKWGVIIYQGRNQHYYINNSNLVVGHYSTLLDNCYELGMKVIKIEYPGLRKIDPELIPLEKFCSIKDYNSMLYKKEIDNSNNLVTFNEFANKIISYF